MSVLRAAAPRECARRSRRSTAPVGLVFASLALSACEAGDRYPQTTFRPVSEFGRMLNDNFYTTFGFTMAILAITVGLILFAAFRFRERPGTPPPKQIHGNTYLEIGWTIVPAIIVVFLLIPTVRTIFATQQEPPADALVVEVIGHQWWWEFHYPEYGITTANEIWMPTGRPVSLEMHSADVIHSFWFPKIGGKRDVNPLPRRPEGQEPKHKNYLLFTVDEPGTYLGQCAEYCGESHAIMRMTARAVEPDRFDQWVSAMKGQARTAPVAGLPAGAAADTALTGTSVDGQPAAVTATPVVQPSTIGQMPVPTGAGNPFRAPMPDSMIIAEGKRIFLGAACTACHAVSNTTAAGVLGPSLTMVGSRPWLGAGAVENTEETMFQWIRDPQSLKPGTLMPGTRRGGGGMAPTGLTDAEVRAVAAYLSSLKQ